MLTTSPTNIYANWKCTNCQHVLKSKEVEELIETLEKEVSELPLDRDVYEEKLKSYSKLLHPNHHIMIDLKFTLVQVISLGFFMFLYNQRIKILICRFCIYNLHLFIGIF